MHIRDFIGAHCAANDISVLRTINDQLRQISSMFPVFVLRMGHLNGFAMRRFIVLIDISIENMVY